MKYTDITDPKSSDSFIRHVKRVLFFFMNISYPPSGRAALVNIIILGTYDTCLTAANTSAQATEIDAEALKIVNNFCADIQYRDGMTQQQIDAIVNFPH